MTASQNMDFRDPNATEDDLAHSVQDSRDNKLASQGNVQLMDSKLSMGDIDDSLAAAKDRDVHAFEKQQQFDSGYFAENSALKLSFMNVKKN